VTIRIRRPARHDHRCRFVDARGRLTPVRGCGRPIRLLARGRNHWSLRLPLHLPRGRYTLVAVAVDTAGNAEASRRGRNALRLVVR
jgi:hypothetical protein